MPNFSILMLDRSKVTTTASTLNLGDGSALIGQKFTIQSGATTGSVQISDSDSWYDDDERTQTLTSAQVLNGVSYPSGWVVEQEYALTLTDGTSSWKVYALSVHESTRSDLNVVGFVFTGSFPPRGMPLTISATSEGDANKTAYSTLLAPGSAPLPMCFAAGTRIATPEGGRPVESIRPGDLVLTERGAEPVLLVVARTLLFDRPGAAAQPVRIAAGALGMGLPLRLLILSPQHRICLRRADGGAVLGPVAGLRPLAGVRRMTGRRQVLYLHLLLARHALLLAEGVATESLLGGDLVLQSLGPLPRTLATGVARPVLPLLDMAETRVLARAIRAGKTPLPGDQLSAFASARDLPSSPIANVAAISPSRSPSSTP